MSAMHAATAPPAATLDLPPALTVHLLDPPDATDRAPAPPPSMLRARPSPRPCTTLASTATAQAQAHRNANANARHIRPSSHSVLHPESTSFAIVASEFNDIVTERLVSACVSGLQARNAYTDDLPVAWVPGSMELPLAAKRFALSGHHSAVVAIGCVVRGETSHYDAVVRGATSGIERASSDSGVPVVFGVLTCDTMEQAIDRAGGKLGNSGDGYAASAVQMANLMHSI